MPNGTILDSVLAPRKFRKSKNSPVILCPTRGSNPRPLVRQSHLRPLDQRGSHTNSVMSPSDVVMNQTVIMMKEVREIKDERHDITNSQVMLWSMYHLTDANMLATPAAKPNTVIRAGAKTKI
uniref:SFRICE_016934 n=1 Tax=Spodoptera frugiperda TaxID=7108 RepID=A0A2H1W012_SPOFR